MNETRDFSTAALLSLSTGVLFCNFSDMHEAAEYLMGHPIWTHHFVSKELVDKMRDRLIAQHPELPTEVKGTDRNNWQAKLAEIESAIGKRMSIAKGGGETAMHPLEGIPDGKPVVVIGVDK